jgi:hypothetical protein
VARDLAERLLALAAAGPGSTPEAHQLAAAVPGLSERPGDLWAEGVGAAEMERSLLDGGDFAYVVALPLLAPDPCAEAAALIERAPFLGGLGDGFPEALIPLVDTSGRAVVRKGAVGVSVDGYGTVRVIGSAPPAAAPPQKR